MTEADHDRPYAVALNIDAPPSPDYVLELAETFAELVRVMIHQVMHHEALEYPAEAYALILAIERGVSGLGQLLPRVSAWLHAEYEEDRIRMTGGEFPEPLLAVMAVDARLGKAAEHAEELRGMLDSAAAVMSAMAARREEDDGG